MEKIRIAIAENQTLLRQMLSLLFKSVESFELVAAAENGETLLTKLAQLSFVPDITIIDVKMPGIGGLELNQAVQRAYPQTKVIVLALSYEKRSISAMIEAGARSYLDKSCDKEELITAITSVYRYGFYMNSHILNAIQSAAQERNRAVKTLAAVPFNITKREKEILQLICQEYSNAEIAERIYLSVRTVEGHRNNLILKTGRKNTAGLVLFAIKHKIYDLSLYEYQ